MATAAHTTGADTRPSTTFLDDITCWLEQAQGILNTVAEATEANGPPSGGQLAAIYGADTLLDLARKSLSNGHSALLKALHS